MPGPENRIPRGLVVTIAVLQLVLGVLLAQIYLTSHNTLYNNGNWSVSKTKLWNGLIGSYSFLFDLQPLTEGFLNVAAWHGYQEVILERELDPASVEFDFFLAKKSSYLTFSFNRGGSRYDAIRLSRFRRHPPALLSVSEDLEFLRKRRLPELGSAAIGSWQTLRVEFADDAVSAFLNGERIEKLDRLRTRVVRPQAIGFRGGASPVFIDNIRIVETDGSEFHETFSRPRNFLAAYVVAIGGVLVLGWLAFFGLRRVVSLSDKHLLFFVLMATGVLVVAATAALVLVSHRTGFYPNAGEKLKRQEAYWKDASAEKLAADIEEKYSKQPSPEVHRFVVLGSSQTAGAGAPTEEETWVRRTERLLNERSRGPRYELINAAVRGYVLKEMVEEFESRWASWNPHTVILNASHNDRGAPERFERYLDRLLRRCRLAGIQVVLIQEPNAGRRGSKELLRLHSTMATLGERYAMPVLDLQAPLAARGDDGFLWWDGVHMTTFGQKLFAEQLVEELDELGIVELEEPKPAAGSQAVRSPQRRQSDP